MAKEPKNKKKNFGLKNWQIATIGLLGFTIIAIWMAGLFGLLVFSDGSSQALLTDRKSVV